MKYFVSQIVMFRVNQALWAIFMNLRENFEELKRAILSGGIRHIDTISELQLDSPRS